MTLWRERIKHWPVVGYISGLAWAILKLPTVVEHVQASDRYFREFVEQQLSRTSEHSIRLHELLDFRAVSESNFAHIKTDIHKLRSQLDEKAERRSIQDAQQLIAKLTFHKADRHSIAELQRLIAELQERAIPPQNAGPVIADGRQNDQRYQQYLDRLQATAISRSTPPLLLHIGPASAEWRDALVAGGFPVQMLDGETANPLEPLRQTANCVASTVTCFHIVERLGFHELVLLLDETLRILEPGGVAIFETAHPLATVASGPAPGHPVFPETLAGLAQLRGFHSSECAVLENVVTWTGTKRLDPPVPVHRPNE